MQNSIIVPLMEDLRSHFLDLLNEKTSISFATGAYGYSSVTNKKVFVFMLTSYNECLIHELQAVLSKRNPIVDCDTNNTEEKTQ